ncbi:HPr kinase/phosphorylase [uncultured Methylobacterium sp.]|uniref:HPr kinase/phosphorylase n=1 Tax=uncultured Methylobacterium sp. TaxID=157278 RepID=UPI0035CB61D9
MSTEPAPPGTRDTIHATCVVIGEAGVLIRGVAGAGKSSLARALIAGAGLTGKLGALVGDDRVRVAAVNGRLVARPHPVIAGLIEIRGHGIVAVEAVPACVVRLVVDLQEAGPRLPETPASDAAILGIRLPRLAIDRASREAGLAALLVLAAASVSSQPHTRVHDGPDGARP